MRKYLKKTLHGMSTLLLWGILVFLPQFLYAQGSIPGGRDDPPVHEGLQNPIQFNSIREFLEAFLEVVIQVGAPLVVLAIIYTGFLFVRAQGAPEGLQKAKEAFFWTIIGALLILGASAILILLEGTVQGLRG